MSIRALEQKIIEYKELQRMQEELEAELDAIKTTIRENMGGAEIITVGAFKVSDKLVESRRLDASAIKAELPDVAARYTKVTASHRFLIA